MTEHLEGLAYRLAHLLGCAQMQVRGCADAPQESFPVAQRSHDLALVLPAKRFMRLLLKSMLINGGTASDAVLFVKGDKQWESTVKTAAAAAATTLVVNGDDDGKVNGYTPTTSD